MREIKFRIWDETRDKMHEHDNISYIDFKENLVCVYDYIDYYEDTRFLFKNDSVIMQYTGLKDKNGKEIYEGDILDYGEFGKYKVVFSKALFKIQKLDNLNGNLHLLGECFLDEIEVVGNIYEIPEFLK